MPTSTSQAIPVYLLDESIPLRYTLGHPGNSYLMQVGSSCIVISFA
jgi:hypothetical protein